MSRSGYSDEIDDQWAWIRWRGAVDSAIKGKRGQALLREALEALDAMPVKRLIADSLATAEGEFCTLGVVGAARKMGMDRIDPDDRHQVAKEFGIAEALAAEIMYENDTDFGDSQKRVEVELCGPVRPWYPEYGEHIKVLYVQDEREAEKRWARMRAWVASNIKQT